MQVVFAFIRNPQNRQQPVAGQCTIYFDVQHARCRLTGVYVYHVRTENPFIQPVHKVPWVVGVKDVGVVTDGVFFSVFLGQVFGVAWS